MSTNLETLKEKTEAARTKYEEAVATERAALLARQNHLSSIGSIPSGSRAMVDSPAITPTAPKAARRGRPRGSKNRVQKLVAQIHALPEVKTKKAPSPAQLASRRLQGKYIAAIRSVPESRC